MVGVHGSPPYRIAVVHGGPGACGSLARMAEELSQRMDQGVLEPIQAAGTLEGLTDECMVSCRHSLPQNGCRLWDILGEGGCPYFVRQNTLGRSLPWSWWDVRLLKIGTYRRFSKTVWGNYPPGNGPVLPVCSKDWLAGLLKKKYDR